MDFPPEVQAAILNHKPQLEPEHVGEEESIRFAVCIDNTGYLAALELYKIYPVLQDDILPADCVRVVDESGEDYVYPTRYFAPVELPTSVEDSILQHLYQIENPNI